MKKKIIDTITKPDKILRKGIQTLSDVTLLPFHLYSKLKSEAKSKNEITFIGKKKIEKVKTQLYVFSEASCLHQEQISNFDSINNPEENANYWLNFHGIHDVSLIKKVSKTLHWDPLTARQLVDTTQRPKVDDYDHYLFFSVKSILQKAEEGLYVEQLSFVLGKNYVVSFQEEVGDHFDHIRSRLREDLGQVRKRGCDYLLSQLLDAILDNYFETIDLINQEVAQLEAETLLSPTRNTLLLIEKNKKNVEMIKKSLSPFREALSNIIKDRTEYISKGSKKYFRDLNNSCSYAIEEVNSTYNSLEGLTNIYFASLSHKMNETMKVLTTVATIFIPLTFIAGIYGMNFENMPELKWRYGYFGIWGVMITVLIGMIIYFKRKKWL